MTRQAFRYRPLMIYTPSLTDDMICSSNYLAMSSDLKPTVTKEETFDKLDIRVGRLVSVEIAAGPMKLSYRLKADFGRFGVKTSIARLTSHKPDELVGRQILGLLNIGTREVGGVVSEFLCLGVQVPGAESGEAMIVTPLTNSKLGSKLF